MIDYSPIFEGLTQKQRLYVQARLQGMSKRAAARAAGCGENPDHSADQYEKNPAVVAAIERGQQMSAEHMGYTREKVARMFQEAYDLAESAAEKVMAARELGKLFGLYAPTNVKVDHSHRLEDVRTEADIRRLPTTELLKLAHTKGGDFIEGEFMEVEPLRLTDERKQASS